MAITKVKELHRCLLVKHNIGDCSFRVNGIKTFLNKLDILLSYNGILGRRYSISNDNDMLKIDFVLLFKLNKLKKILTA